MPFDALLILSFGGPEGPDDVMPFLHNVLRGRPVRPERLDEVAAHYLRFGGHSPINDQNRALVADLRHSLGARPAPLEVYWGNRNWEPYLIDTLRSMRADGVRRAAAFVTSAYSSYSGCRQYLLDIEAARTALGVGVPEVVKLRPYFNHPGFVLPLAAGLRAARAEAGPGASVLMTAHSIPTSLAARCDYEIQLRETGRLVAEAAGEAPDGWSQVFQSRSGPPGQPWLGPDIIEAIEALPGTADAVIVVPTGFVSDHMEVVYDLDTEAAGAAAARGTKLVRSATPGIHPRFVEMVGQLVDELECPGAPARALGDLGPRLSPCRAGCCPPPPK